VGLTIKWVPVDERTRFDAIVNDTADMECGSTTVSLSRMKIVDFSSVVFADSTGVLVKSGKELFTFDNMAGKNIGVVAGTTNARAVRDQLARRNLSGHWSSSETDVRVLQHWHAAIWMALPAISLYCSP